MSAPLRQRCNEIETGYVFMLGYAGQGVSGEPGASHAEEARATLQSLAASIDGIAGAIRDEVAGGDAALAACLPFLEALEADARASLAAVRLVLAQPAISSKLVDNLNASIHLRALLTDIFLVDEVLAAQVRRPADVP